MRNHNKEFKLLETFRVKGVSTEAYGNNGIFVIPFRSFILTLIEECMADHRPHYECVAMIRGSHSHQSVVPMVR